MSWSGAWAVAAGDREEPSLHIAALALALAAAGAHAAWNVLAKRAGRGVAFVFAYGAAGVVLWAPLGLGARAGLRPRRYRGMRADGGQRGPARRLLRAAATRLYDRRPVACLSPRAWDGAAACGAARGGRARPAPRRPPPG